MRRVRAVLFDIDGVLTVWWKPLPGAVAALHGLPMPSEADLSRVG
jgi:ribonucleotide monophosphatase NagD (HAD superfamily)